MIGLESMRKRVGTSAITVHYSEAVRRQLETSASENHRIMNDAVGKALNPFLKRHCKPEIASRKASRRGS